MPGQQSRRKFLKASLAHSGAIAMCGAGAATAAESLADRAETERSGREYSGPNVIIVRFGGGVRRRETIHPEQTYAPYFLQQLAPRGTLFTQMEISSEDGVETGHGQGTLNVLTGRYDDYKDVAGRFLGQRFEARAPTLFEYLRKTFDVLPHQSLIINGEDRTDEEFYSFSNHHLFGVNYRSSVLSLHRFKTFLLRKQIASDSFDDQELRAKRKLLAKLEAIDHRRVEKRETLGQGEEITEFWQQWRRRYGDSGLKNPRGDRLLTELATSAMRKLQPRLMMINYNDPDYVHWGFLSHYTRGIAIIDAGLKRLAAAVEADPFYRGNTIFAIVPDCGRDNNRFMSIPCQHHFNTRSSREIFALFVGPGIERGRVVDKPCEQISVAPTIARLMGIRAKFSQGPVLEEAIS